MQLKRKRSESELSTSTSSSSLFSSPPRPGGFAFSFSMDASPTPPRLLAFARAAGPAHLSGRTFKRFRDNRPSEDEVHRMFLAHDVLVS